MRRVIPVFLALVCLPLVASAPAAASRMPSPDSFKYLVLPALGDEGFSIDFEYSGGSWATMIAITTSDSLGHASSSYSVLSYRGQQSTYGIRNGDQRTTTTRSDQVLPSRVDSRSFGFGFAEREVLRVGLASWGGSGTFKVKIGDDEISAGEADPSRVTIAAAMDFDDGVAAEAGPLDAGLMTSTSVEGEGYLFGFFMPNSLGRGFVTRDGSPRDHDIAEPGGGTWSFSIQAAASQLGAGGAPVLWLMDFPA